MKILISGIVCAALFAGCNRSQEVTKEYAATKDGFTVSTYVANKLSTRQHFTRDSVPDGPLAKYASDGSLQQWTWYKHGLRRFAAYYENGKAVELKGNPFLFTQKQNAQDHLLVEMIRPPKASIIARLYKVRNQNIEDYTEYPVVDEDSTCYIVLGVRDSFHYDANYKYALSYYLVDSAKQTIKSAECIMKVTPTEYKFIQIKQETEPLRDQEDVQQ